MYFRHIEWLDDFMSLYVFKGHISEMYAAVIATPVC